MIRDVNAAIEFLQDKGVSEEDIMLFARTAQAKFNTHVVPAGDALAVRKIVLNPSILTSPGEPNHNIYIYSFHFTLLFS